MDTDRFKVDLSFEIQPQWQDVPPRVSVTLDDATAWHDLLRKTKTFDYSKNLAKGKHELRVELLDKPDCDAYQSLIIRNLAVGRIQSPRFLWQGVYTPRYPEPWASQQRARGIKLQSHLHNTDCLGWNGVWCLEFTVPVFTWIHQIEGLGWTYD